MPAQHLHLHGQHLLAAGLQGGQETFELFLADLAEEVFELLLGLLEFVDRLLLVVGGLGVLLLGDVVLGLLRCSLRRPRLASCRWPRRLAAAGGGRLLRRRLLGRCLLLRLRRRLLGWLGFALPLAWLWPLLFWPALGLALLGFAAPLG